VNSKPLNIIHVDMDAFFAAVEQHDNPELVGKPVIVGGLGRRGVVATASYEAREFGVHSAMPMSRARKACLEGIFVEPRFKRYKEISDKIRSIFRSYTPLVEPMSFDEAFLDVTESLKQFGSAIKVAEEIKSRILQETGLICSVGIAPNKFLAKLASDLEKPDGFVVIKEDEAQKILDDLPVRKIWGVGKVMEHKLNELGINTIKELRNMSMAELKNRFGKWGISLYKLARGIDEQPVVPVREAKSISNEVTFSNDLHDPKDIKKVLFELSESVGKRLQTHGLKGRTIEIKIRFSDFTTITRSKSITNATDSIEVIREQAEYLFDEKVDLNEMGVRLAGVGVANLTKEESGQLQLFR
jgi:DNA polymerase-4